MASTTYVSSSVYNLAGDVNKRTNFLKTTVVGAVINDSDIGQTITDSYLRGPGIKLRSFAKWARTKGYSNIVGLAVGTFGNSSHVNSETVAAYLPTQAGAVTTVQNASIGPGDFIQWAEQYMGIYYPEELLTNWITDFDPTSGLITINRVGGGTVVFMPSGFSPNDNYLYVLYNFVSDQVIYPTNTGAVVEGDFPPMINPLVISNDTTNTPTVLHNNTKEEITYSDATPPSTTNTPSTVDTVITNIEKVQQNTTVQPSGRLLDTIQFLSQVGSVVSTDEVTTTTTDMGGGVTRTTKTTVTTESVEYLRTYRIDTRERELGVIGPTQRFIYRQGTGNAALDAMFYSSGSMGTFFPYIPFRIENTFVSPSAYSDLYVASKKALKKAVDGKFDKIIESLTQNASIGDIDFAYGVFGVSLNTKEKEAKRYLYTFFEQCVQQSNAGMTYAEWKAYNTYRDAQLTAFNSYYAGMNSDYGYTGGVMVWNPATQQWEVVPVPVVPPYINPPSYSINITSGNAPSLNYNITMSWMDMALSTGTGLGRAGAVVGDLWFDQLADESYNTYLTYTDYEANSTFTQVTPNNIEKISLTFQESSNRWRKITVLGLVHQNMVYHGKSVVISSKQALNDPEESGFIVPLHEEIFADTPLVARTQMANSCFYLMLNSYTIVKKKWYQSGFFMILIIVVIIVIAIYYPPATAYLAKAGGVLGANVAVGAALGFSGLAAVLVGAAANAIAAMFVMKIITAGATAIFGEKIGAIIGFVASIYALQAGTAYMSGQQFSMASMYSSMMKAENLLKLTMAVGDGISAYVQASTKETIEDTNKLMGDYGKKSKEIAQLYENEFGTDSRGVIDPMAFTDVTLPGYEPSDVFLNRTLMTGSDIVQISLDMISKFPELTLDLQLQT